MHLGDGHNLGTKGGEIALDCSLRETRHNGIYSISTTDFFFPLVDSPYLQGRIGAANALSDLYALGTGDCDFVLMLLAACRDMPEEARNICTREMIRGFQDACQEAEAPITGGQTVLNPWPIIGGVATSIVKEGEFVSPDGAQVGDVLVLTKPLGTQIAVNVHEWRTSSTSDHKNKFWAKCEEKQIVTDQEAEDMMHKAVCSMARLNRIGARLMTKHNAHAATDVTGFGILGHTQNLADNQLEAVGMELSVLPCIKKTMAVNDEVFDFRLGIGYSAETSGGLLICMTEADAKAFCQELMESDNGCPAWIIGKVVADPERKAKLDPDVRILEV